MVEAELPSQLAVQQGVGCPPRDPLQPEAARAIDDQGYQLGEGQHTIVARPVLHTPYFPFGTVEHSTARFRVLLVVYARTMLVADALGHRKADVA